ncbi:serine protease FAM111A-like [Pempheris klunzingeri]|uniref:serine protease FAM111A-like n=1 Tax=Pempheris klunzingeri TaxID=3127111 RepID=UPI0039808E13
MEPKLKPKNNGPMDKFDKEETGDQDGESRETAGMPCDVPKPPVQCQLGLAPAPCDPQNIEEEEPLLTHPFEMRLGDLLQTRKESQVSRSRFLDPLWNMNTRESMIEHNCCVAPETSPIRDSKRQIQSHLSSDSENVLNLVRVEYGKNSQACSEVKMMRKLMELANSVCQVRINSRAEGSGFLLFDKYVLTNGHIFENIYDKTTGQLNEKVTVHFFFESLDQADRGAEVEEVVGFEYCHSESGSEYDWALLRLNADQKLSDGLLPHFRFPPERGRIWIIGHPDGGVKKIDPCLIIPTDSRIQVVERHYHENPEGISHYSENQGRIHLVSHNFFESVAEAVGQKQQALTYESCFYFGSSGSPVFDEHCNVVAMHSGGYAYLNANGKTQSVLEFGYRLSAIIEHIIIQIVQAGKFDVLKKYLACSYSQHQNMMTNLKRLVETSNLTAFRNAVNSSEASDDRNLKRFFEFFSQKEEVIQMELA